MAATRTARPADHPTRKPAAKPRWGEGREDIELLPLPAFLAEPGFTTDDAAREHLARHAAPVSDALAGVAKTIADPLIAPAAVVVLDSPRRYAIDASAMDGPLFFMGERLSRVVKFGVAGELFMSDTPMEIATCARAVNRAWGDVAVYGLGMGLILPGLLRNPNVASVTVLEIAPAAIDLIEPVVRSTLTPRENAALTIVQGDARTVAVRADLRRRFDTVWSDIWPDVTFKNLPEIHAIERASRAVLRHPNARRPAGRSRFVASWSVGILRNHQLFSRVRSEGVHPASAAFAEDARAIIGRDNFSAWARAVRAICECPTRTSEAVAFGLLIRNELPTNGGPVTDDDVATWGRDIRERAGGDPRRMMAVAAQLRR